MTAEDGGAVPELPQLSRAADSTFSDLGDGRYPRLARLIRRTSGLLMLLVVLAGAAGMLGVHSTRVTAHSDGYTLTVEYAGVARAGLDVPLRVTIVPDRKFSDSITLAISREYLAIFETQGFHPEPSDTANRGDDVLLTFDTPPDASPFVMDYDAYIQPASQQGADCRISIMHGADRLTSVRFTTFLFP